MQTTEMKQYGPYLIQADPPKLESGRWATYLVISRERPDGTAVRPFDDDLTFDTRLEAVRHCFAMGRDIIDGKVPGRTVEDL